MPQLIAGNWKMHCLATEAVALAREGGHARDLAGVLLNALHAGDKGSFAVTENGGVKTVITFEKQ